MILPNNAESFRSLWIPSFTTPDKRTVSLMINQQLVPGGKCDLRDGTVADVDTYRGA